jgi:hypothetical protein
MIKIIRQILRGCGNLPCAGEHPGTTMLLGLIIIGLVAGSKNGFWGVVVGGAVMAIGIGPIYLFGAYDRANLSDHVGTTEGQS